MASALTSLQNSYIKFPTNEGQISEIKGSFSPWPECPTLLVWLQLSLPRHRDCLIMLKAQLGEQLNALMVFLNRVVSLIYLCVEPKLACNIIRACLVLHNIAQARRVPLFEDQADTQPCWEARDLSEPPPPHQPDEPAGRAIRSAMVNLYFSWQMSKSLKVVLYIEKTTHYEGGNVSKAQEETQRRLKGWKTRIKFLIGDQVLRQNVRSQQQKGGKLDGNFMGRSQKLPWRARVRTI